MLAGAAKTTAGSSCRLRCVSAAAGTGANGASIEGQSVAAVVTTLRDTRAHGDEHP
jgi:hypothetical protein